MFRVDPSFYSAITKPNRTRSGAIPIHSFPLEKRQITHNTILDPYRHVYNTQGFSSSKIGDADADAGKYYYIHIDSYDTTPKTTCVIDEVSPLMMNPVNFIPGAYYTYVITSIIGKDPATNDTVVLSQSNDGMPQIYATRAMNMYEFGTKHHQIMYRMAKKDSALFAELSKTYNNVSYRIYAAGEIMCVNNNALIFNFISGTYKMKRCISAKRAKYEAAYIRYMMRNIAPDYTDIVFQPNALIKEDVMTLTKQELSRLRQHNIPLFMFDTQRQCNSMKYAIIRHHRAKKSITVDELRELYITYSSPE
jgi:hypothetical protein